MAVGEEADAFVQQLVEQAPLTVGDDAVADPRQQHRGTVGGKALHREDHHRDQADDDDAVIVVADIGLVRHGAEEIGGQRRTGGGNPHQHESDGIARPVAECLIDEQAAHQHKS